MKLFKIAHLVYDKGVVLFRKNFHKKESVMKAQLFVLGLPLKTWIIVGGLYVLATFLPFFVAWMLKRKEGRAE